MEQNKLNPCNFCLTVEQSKELIEIGIDMKDSLFSYFRDFIFLTENKWQENFKLHFTVSTFSKIYPCYEIYPTLSNSEMLEMLPQYINFNKKLRIYKSQDEIKNTWIVSYEKDGCGVYIKTGEILRDALYEILS